MEALVQQRINLILILLKQTQNFPVCVYSTIFIIFLWFFNGKQIFKFKANNEKFNFPTEFCPGIISNGVSPTESGEVSLNGSVYYSSLDYSSIDKSDILNKTSI